MNSCAVYVSFTPEVEKLLSDNDIDLVAEMRRQGLEVDKSHGLDPAAPKENLTKDPTLIILASAAAVLSLGTAISQILDAVARGRKVLCRTRELIPVLDQGGSPIRDKNGDPVLQWVDRSRLLEAKEVTGGKTKLSVSFSLSDGMRIVSTTGGTDG